MAGIKDIVAVTKQEELEKEEAKLQITRSYNDSITQILQTEIATLEAEVEASHSSGLLASIGALFALKKKDSVILWTLLILHLFFLGVDLLPLSLKLSGRKEQIYFALIQAKEHSILEAYERSQEAMIEALKEKSLHDIRIEGLQNAISTYQQSLALEERLRNTSIEELKKHAQQFLKEKASLSEIQSDDSFAEELEQQLESIYTSSLTRLVALGDQAQHAFTKTSTQSEDWYSTGNTVNIYP